MIITVKGWSGVSVAGTVKTAPCVFFLLNFYGHLPSIGALQLMRGRTVHPRIPEIPPIYVQRCRLLPS